jgi:hypothetical protein
MGTQELRVSIIGETVLLEGVVVSLENNPHINMQQLAGSNDILHPVAAFRPNVIIYPVGCPEIEEVLARLRTILDVRLIGMEIDRNRVTITDSHIHQFLSLNEFQKLIENASSELVQPFGSLSPNTVGNELAA